MRWYAYRALLQRQYRCETLLNYHWLAQPHFLAEINVLGEVAQPFAILRGALRPRRFPRSCSVPQMRRETPMVAALASARIHSRRRAADELGVEDPEGELRRWQEEQGA